MNYRRLVGGEGLVGFTLRLKESNLFIMACGDLTSFALNALIRVRREIEEYIASHPEFAVSLVPVPVADDAPEVVKAMARAAKAAGVGPMAAVAGAIAGEVGMELTSHSKEVIVENGGDIFMVSQRPRVVSIYAGDSPLSMRVGIRLEPGTWGVATSSATVGHSLSFGKADAAVVVSRDPALSDALATALCNRVGGVDDVEDALEWVMEVDGVEGAVVIVGRHLGAAGRITLVRT